MLVLANTASVFGQAGREPSATETTTAALPSNYNQNDNQDERSTASQAKEFPDSPHPNDTKNKIATLPQAMLHDQIGMWTSPSRLRYSDATWLVPLGGLSAALFATDSDFSRHLSNAPNTLTQSRHISEYGTYSMAGAAGGAYFLGLLTHNEHQRETGFLSGESALNALIAVEALKYATGRERPFQDSGTGKFFQSGGSFPSEHAAAAWAIAGIFAHEYPSPFVRFLSYGMAGVVSATRITSKQHFPSDVLVGAALGYLTSQYIYRKHHNPELSGSAWEIPAVRPGQPMRWQSKFMGSPYVPLDSWIYPALERLNALGYISSAITAMRPWTRMECARLLSEAGDRVLDDQGNGEAAAIYHDLMNEFAAEVERLGGGNNAEFRVESIYTRSTEIAGKPLTDGYHFGQTIVNDFGRPEEQGFNNVSGVSGWTAAGPFAVYVHGEYQHSPSAPALPLSAREAISMADFSHSIVPSPFPVAPDTPISAVDRFRLLDSYVAMNLSNWQISYGKQSLWWGADEGGGLMLSDNADPLTMFRVNRVSPFKLAVVGPMRVEFFVGQYSGYEFMFTPAGLVGQYGQSLHPQPIVHGERFSFKPTPNFEFGLSRTTDYGGPGYPLTWHTFVRSVFSTDQTIPGAPDKPGSRRSGLDFSYRIKDRMTFYADGMTEHDTISPIIGPDVASWLGGIYIPRLPRLAKMDFRAEGVYTDPPIGGNVGSGFFYYNPTWISGYTNSGNLMGNWVGREGQGVQAWTSYWFSPHNKLQFEFRHLKVSHEFIPNGGTLADAGVHADFWVRSSFSVSAAVQYEAWTFPVLSPTKQSNVSSSLQLTFWPKEFSRKGGSSE
ncbi:MAG TPA: capsule assembly Wzi family protein [Candidatus Sulfotelmatobacter sp.]|jgi:membrane-associated phospholipid phosphatase|nr:capsule assembly Wzi family protein [Candidatus Sulfotelmatobacter sp.]